MHLVRETAGGAFSAVQSSAQVSPTLIGPAGQGLSLLVIPSSFANTFEEYILFALVWLTHHGTKSRLAARWNCAKQAWVCEYSGLQRMEYPG